eukprot:184006_1
MALSEEQESHVVQFIGMTGADGDFAKSFLEANNWDVNAAVDIFLSSGGAPVSADNNFGHNSSSGVSAPPMNPGLVGDGVRAPDSATVERLYGGHHRVATSREPFRDYASEWHNSGGQPSERNLADLFAAPHEILFHGTFDEVCNESIVKNKWLLVNLQSVEEFRCHALNRDTWKDRKVRNLVEDSFILWQIDSESSAGSTFRRFYNTSTFPYVAVIDPRTRMEMVSWISTGELEPGKLLENLHEFLANHSLDVHADAKTTNDSERSRKSSHELSEEEQLKRAIEASLNPIDDEIPDEEHFHHRNTSMSSSWDQWGDSTMDSTVDRPGHSTSPSSPTSKRMREDENRSKSDSDAKRRAISAEPPTGPDATSVRIRVSGGCLVTRRFLKTATIQSLYDFVLFGVDHESVTSRKSSGKTKFSLVCSFPRKSLEDMQATLEEAGVLNSQLIVQWEKK